MVTNKAFTIRLGQTAPWPTNQASQNWYQYHLNVKLKYFFEKFFGDKFFQNRGISFSHVLLNFLNSQLALEVFVHDSKLYDFYATKPFRRALRIVNKKKKLKKLFKNFKKYKKFIFRFIKKRKFKTWKPKRIKKKSLQSQFKVSSSKFFFRTNLFNSSTTKIKKNFNINVSKPQTLESKIKKNREFRLRFRNVRKFVKIARKRQKKFKKSKFKIFKIVKIKKSSKKFNLAKLNYLLGRRRTLNSLFLFKLFKKKKFKKKKFKFRRNFKKYSRRHKNNRRTWQFHRAIRIHEPYSEKQKRYELKRKFYYAKKRARSSKFIARRNCRKKYFRKKLQIHKKFVNRFSRKLKIFKYKLLKSYKDFYRVNKAPDKLKIFARKAFLAYRIKKISSFQHLKNIKKLRLKNLDRSKLGRKYFNFFSKKIKKRYSSKKLIKKKKAYKKVLLNQRKRRKPTRHSNNNFRLPKKNKFKFKKKIRYPFWKLRYSPVQEIEKKAGRFVFFSPLSAYASSRFIRYSFYKILAKILSYQIFKNFSIPVFVNFSFFPLHRAGSDFYLNFITTKLYYRYILSDIIKPIVRISLKFYRGFVIHCRGRFTRAQIAVAKKFTRKSVSYSKITSSLDYAQRSVVLKYGTCNLRIWIRK